MNETPQQNQPPAQPAAAPQPTTPPVQEPKPLTSEPPHASEPKKGMPKSPFLYALLTFLVGIGVGYLLIVLFPGNKVAENQMEKAQAKNVTLPSDAIKVHECVDKKGELHASPKDLPQGPIYMVDKDKVIGLEYVLNKEVFAIGKMYDELNTLQAGVNHMQVASMSAGYDGIPGDYYVVDLYVVDKKTQDAITCAVPSPTIPEASPSATVNVIPSIVISAQPILSPAVVISPAPSPIPSL
jgi:hypothetical protein